MASRRRWSGRRHRWSNADWSAWHDRQRRLVSIRYGGIDQDVTEAFFQLSESQLARVFEDYGQRHGASAVAYARQAYAGWRSGAKRMAGTTLERMLDIVPAALSLESKVNLYRRMRERHRLRENVTVRIGNANDLRLVTEAANRIAERSKTQSLRPEVEARLTWLSERDGAVAKSLVTTVEHRESVLIAQAVDDELESLRAMLRDPRLVDSAEHIVELPCGSIKIELRMSGRWPMSTDRSDQNPRLPMTREPIPPARSVPSILETVLATTGSDLTPEIVEAAQHEALQLEVRIRQGQISSAAAERELSQFLAHAEDASHINDMSFEAEADFQRASGKTRVRVKKVERRWWWPFG